MDSVKYFMKREHITNVQARCTLNHCCASVITMKNLSECQVLEGPWHTHTCGPIFMAVQQPVQVALQLFVIYLTLKFAHLCGVLVPSAECTVQRWEERCKQVERTFSEAAQRQLVVV